MKKTGKEVIQYFYDPETLEAIQEFVGSSVILCVRKISSTICLEIMINDKLVLTAKPSDYIIKENGLLSCVNEIQYNYDNIPELTTGSNELLEEKIKSLCDLINVQFNSCKGDLYNIGLYNGLAVALSVLSGDNPVFYDERFEVEKDVKTKTYASNCTVDSKPKNEQD